MEEPTKAPALTAKEIADNVQQHFELVAEPYRLLIEQRINYLLEEKCLEIHDGVKRILSHHFTIERDKKRITNVMENQELMNHLGSAFTVIESSVKDDIKRLIIAGEDVLKIVPKRTYEK